jgi:hypothetical protein
MSANDKLTPDTPLNELGEPDGLPDAATVPRYCNKCKAEVIPEGKGKCPRCGSFLRLHFYTRKHPVNVLRRDALFAELAAEFKPTTSTGRFNCELLAAVKEQLEALKPGTTEFHRLVSTMETLSAALHAAQPESHTSHVDTQPCSASEYALPLLERQDRGETLTHDEQVELNLLLRALNGELQWPPDRPVHTGVTTLAPVPVSPTVVDPAPSTSTPTPAPDPAYCKYCMHSPCYGPDHPAFDIIHGDDPVVIEKRRKENFATMLQTMRHGSGITRW